jgi:hypothetical protein
VSEFHVLLYAEFSAQLASSTPTSIADIAGIFERHHAFFKLYSKFHVKYQQRTSNANQLLASSENFRDFVTRKLIVISKELSRGPGKEMKTLAQVQQTVLVRLFQYKLFLHSLAAIDSKAIQGQHAAMKQVLDDIEEQKVQERRAVEMKELHHTIKNYPVGTALVQPKRYLIKRGILNKTESFDWFSSTAYKVLVFNDLLLWVTAEGNEFVGQLGKQELALANSALDKRLAARAIGIQDTRSSSSSSETEDIFLLLGADQSIKEEWMEAFTELCGTEKPIILATPARVQQPKKRARTDAFTPLDMEEPALVAVEQEDVKMSIPPPPGPPGPVVPLPSLSESEDDSNTFARNRAQRKLTSRKRKAASPPPAPPTPPVPAALARNGRRTTTASTPAGRGGLFAQIRQGKALKRSAPLQERAVNPPQSMNLLDSIRQVKLTPKPKARISSTSRPKHSPLSQHMISKLQEHRKCVSGEEDW